MRENRERNAVERPDRYVVDPQFRLAGVLVPLFLDNPEMGQIPPSCGNDRSYYVKREEITLLNVQFIPILRLMIVELRISQNLTGTRHWQNNIPQSSLAYHMDAIAFLWPFLCPVHPLVSFMCLVVKLYHRGQEH